MFKSDFLPGGPAFCFLEGRVQSLKVVSVEFVDPAVCGGGNPYGVAVHVALPAGKTQIFWDNQGVVYPHVEDVLATLLPEGFIGMKVSLSGEPVKQPAVQGAPAPTEQPAPAETKAETGKRGRAKASEEAAPADAPVPPVGADADMGGGNSPEMF